MGAHIYWQPVLTTKRLEVGLRSDFVDAMTHEFGSAPWRLESNPETLRRLAAVNRALDPPETHAFIELGMALRQHLRIEVWPEY